MKNPTLTVVRGFTTSLRCMRITGNSQYGAGSLRKSIDLVSWAAAIPPALLRGTLPPYEPHGAAIAQVHSVGRRAVRSHETCVVSLLTNVVQGSLVWWVPR